MTRLSVEIRAIWDPDAGVWTATSDDVPGLVTEGETIDDVIERAKQVIPELLEFNHVDVGAKPVDIPVHVVADYRDSVRISG